MSLFFLDTEWFVCAADYCSLTDIVLPHGDDGEVS